ncbi:hypothetical protein BGZ96_009162 [Linnemannia gamsii]|uniref:Uncharacterized protein n=1 Tax=Linnemannia gamsii TaxID=64522 RepID=A0ABQ7JXC3_9FUNG|nr:hypothetical protein BGZ96_009162 [Linnemannia gamsii]
MDNILDSDDPMMALMARAIGTSPTQPQPQQQSSTTTTSAMPTPTTTAATQASPGTQTAGGGHPVTTSAVEFLDAEAETALFLDSMHHSSNNINSLSSSPLPLALPWSPSQDMIWTTEDEILASVGMGMGGSNGGRGGSQQSVDMTLADDIGGGEGEDEMVVGLGLPTTVQELDDGSRGVMMDEDEILPVVVVETVVAPPQAVSPVLGFGMGQRLQHQHQPLQQQSGGVRFNPQQQNNTNNNNNSGGGGSSINNLNRIRTFGKVENLTTHRTTSTAAFMAAAAAQRNGAEKSRPSPPPNVKQEAGVGARVGAEVMGSVVANGGAITAAAAEVEKPEDMEIDTPETAVLAATTTFGSGSESGLVEDVQNSSLREKQETVAQPSLPSWSQPTATSELAPAFELPSAKAPSESVSGVDPAVTGTESAEQLVTVEAEVTKSVAAGPAEQREIDSTVADLAAAESDRIEQIEPITVDQPPSASSQPEPTTPLATHELEQSIDAESPQPSLSTKPTKPPKARRPPVPVQHHPSWHFAPGSDMAFLSEMKGSDSDLKRFRREHEWLEERVRRAKRDHSSDQLLDKALGLTRMVIVPPSLSKGYKNGEETKETKAPSSSKKVSEGQQDKDGEAKGENDTTNSTGNTNAFKNNKYITPVRLSTDSRLAFSILKTNLSAELEEQTRLETDQRILEQIVERTATKVSTTAQLHSQAEERLRDLQTRQPGQERELLKMEKLERACKELRDRQRQQAEEEIRQLEETVRLLECQREQRQREDLKRAERQRSEMECVVASTSASASVVTTSVAAEAH